MTDKIASNYAARVRQRLLAQQSAGSDSRVATFLPVSPASDSDLMNAEPVSTDKAKDINFAATSSPSPDEIRQALNEVEATAAVSGRVQPDELFSPEIELKVRQEVLSQLVSQCLIETHTGRVQWLLRPDKRRVVLEHLWKSGQLVNRLAQTLPGTDHFGEILREVLRGGANVSLQNRTLDDLLELSAVVELLHGTDIPRPDAGILRQQVGRESFLKDYRLLLAHGIWGRDSERQQLWQFVTDSNFQRAYAQAPLFVPWSGLLLTGLGGAGKSTLLAQFILDIAQSNAATIVILDFDRPGIEPDDLPWLEAEISRQVGQQFPQAAEFLRDTRHEARQDNEAAREFEAQLEAASSDRSVRYLLNVVRNVLMSEAGSRPFLLVLDTFEEVVQRGLAERVLEWLGEVVSRLQNIPLKVIISGRVLTTPEEEARGEQVPAIFQNSGVTSAMEVGELDPVAAEQLLTSLQVNPEMAFRLASSDVLPRRPLELKLLARLVTETQHKDSSIEDLERELREGGSAAGELFAGLVYRRVLLRVDDTTVAGQTVTKLAYPGLVLRYLTSQLIREVLVPALNLAAIEEQSQKPSEVPTRQLAPLSETEAQTALDSLASYNWLAYRGANGEVWHRKDLRRSMIKAMRAHEPKIARHISTKAVEFFTARYNLQSDPRDWAEAIYHRLMMVQTPEDGDGFKLDDLKTAQSFIGPDEVDLPPAAAALLHFATGHKTVALSEVELLPRRYLGQIYHQTGQGLTDNRNPEFGKALALYQRYRSGSGEENILAPTESWERDTLFATVSWDELAMRHELPTEVPSSSRNMEIFKAWITMLFTSAVANPETLDARTFSTLIDNIFKLEVALPFSHSLLQDSNLLHRITTSLLLLRQNPNGDAFGFPLETAHMVEFWKEEQLFKSTGSDVVPRRLLFLELAGWKRVRPPQIAINLSPSTLKLDAAWLNQFVRPTTQSVTPIDEEARNLADRARQILSSASSDGSPQTVRTLLGDIDNVSRSSKGTDPRAFEININWFGISAPTFLDLFRGPDPEFRDPCRFALLEAYLDRAGRERLAEIIAPLLSFKVADLSPTVFAEALVFRPEHALELYIELVDRAWLLGELLRRAHEDRPDSIKLARVWAAYSRWDAAVKSAVESALS